MNNYAQEFLADAETVRETVFWKEFIKAVYGKEKHAIERCITNDNVARHQGEVRAIRSVLALPDKLVDEFKKIAQGDSDSEALGRGD